jgi:WD40-like Beta Propeller Repeat
MRSGALAFALCALACAGPGSVDLKRLPESPIAVMYRDERLALDRVDALRDIEKFQKPADTEGVVRLETLDAMFGGSPQVEQRLRQVQGRMALVDPANGEATHVDGMPTSAKPLAWSPDHSKLLMMGFWRDAAQLFLWDRASSTTEIQTSGPAEHPLGCIGPEGRLVAVEATRVGQGYRARLMATPPGGGGGLRPVTDGPWDIAPACSPTGPFVAYVTVEEDGSQVVAVLALDDPDNKRHRFGRGTDPVFTPDGQWIVYAARTTQGQRLVRVRPDGTGRAPLGGGPDDESQPAVSPDGAYVAYVVTDPEKRERLRVRRFPDGSGDRPLVTTGDASAPVW